MESRRVVLLTEGFLNGWLKFENKSLLSATREEYILAMIEKKYALEALNLKTSVEASLVSGAITKETIKLAYDNYSRYLALALPYMKKNDTIEDNGHMLSKTEQEHWKNFLKEKKKWASDIKFEK